MMISADIRQKVADELRRRAGVQTGGILIPDETKLYEDLNIYGDDFYEFVLWFRREFDIAPLARMSDYVPGESALPLFVARLWRAILKKAPPYSDITMGEIISVIESGRWPARGVG